MLKKIQEAEQTLLKNNDEDMKLSENKVSQECETPNDNILAVKDKFKGFGKQIK